MGMITESLDDAAGPGTPLGGWGLGGTLTLRFGKRLLVRGGSTGTGMQKLCQEGLGADSQVV